jgi:hypothetical protein
MARRGSSISEFAYFKEERAIRADEVLFLTFAHITKKIPNDTKYPEYCYDDWNLLPLFVFDE